MRLPHRVARLTAWVVGLGRRREAGVGDRRRRRRIRLAVALAILATAIGAVAGNTIGRLAGATVVAMSPEDLSTLLRPFYRTTVPPGDGPFPTAILLSGCDGPHDNLDRWAARLTTDGWASVVVDSHGPRGFGAYELWRLICVGQLLMGSERAGDLLVALDDVRRMPFVDPERIALIGSSHGGWTIMDLFAFDPPRRLPYNVTAVPGGSDDPLRGVVAGILLYPWCGIGNAARDEGWPGTVPTMIVLAGRDTIAPARYCDGVIAAQARRGVPLDVLRLPGSDHAFDQEDHGFGSWLAFDPGVTATTLDAATAFLARVSPPPAQEPRRSRAVLPDR